MNALISGQTLQAQWKDIKLRIGYNEIGIPLAGIEPP